MNIGAGAIGPLSNKVFLKWSSFEAFETDVSRFCQTLGARSALVAEIDSASLRDAHEEWMNECQFWLNSHKMPDGSRELSHYKNAGILLRALSDHDFASFSPRGDNESWNAIYGTVDSASDEVKRRLSDGQHHYAAWILCHNIVTWFEENRTDRRTKFTSRITMDFEYDVVSLLVSGLHTSDSLYLVLKALFFRE